MRKNRNITLTATTVLALTQGTYILVALVQSALHAFIAAGIVAFATAEYLSHFRQLHIPRQFVATSTILTFSTVGATATFLLNHTAQLGPVGAAAAIGTLAGWLPVRQHAALDNVRLSLYCGAFAGMSSPAVLANIYIASASGLLCGMLMVASSGSLHGYGGKFGTIAFSSVCITTAGAYIYAVC